MSRVALTNKDIICIATRRIDDSLPTNVQHLMVRLAKHHRILYVEPPVDKVFLARNPAFSYRKPQLENLYSSRLYTIRPQIYPFERRIPYVVHILNRYKFVASIRHAMAEHAIEPEILWIFRPQDFWLTNHLAFKHLCYHVTDKYNTMPVNAKNSKEKRRLDKLEKKMVKEADIVFCTARSLWKEYLIQNNNTIFVGNVADFQHFSKACDQNTIIPNDIAKLPSPIIGFFGAINNFKLDYDLITATAQTVPNGSVVMIGPICGNSPSCANDVPKGKNIFYLGSKDYDSLPGYLKKFEVCIIPYRKTEYTQHVFPLKFFEYLAARKPVVATPLPSLLNFRDFVYMASTVNEWQDSIKKALSEDSSIRQQQRKKLAESNSWAVRVKEIEAIIDDL